MRISPLVFIGSFFLGLGVLFCALLVTTLDNTRVTLGNASHTVYSHVSGANLFSCKKLDSQLAVRTCLLFKTVRKVTMQHYYRQPTTEQN
jgi:hypothetical protein